MAGTSKPSAGVSLLFVYNGGVWTRRAVFAHEYPLSVGPAIIRTRRFDLMGDARLARPQDLLAVEILAKDAVVGEQ